VTQLLASGVMDSKGGGGMTPERVFAKRSMLHITRATDRPTSRVPEHCRSHGIFIVYEANN